LIASASKPTFSCSKIDVFKELGTISPVELTVTIQNAHA
jgi:hypothetical protein